MASALKRSILATAIATFVAAPAYATNGMNMEAYGAKAGGMGGASMAYDTGNSAVMNNPATLALKKEGWDFGVGLTVLQPNVDASFGPGTETASDGDSYLMPSISLMRKQGRFAYGVAVLAQGGMGTEYGAGSFGGSAPEQRSELGFMRVMFPLAYQVSDSLAVAAQLDYVRATLDIKTLMPAVNPATGQPLGPAPGAYAVVSDDSDYNGEMEGDGWAFKLGAHYKINKSFAIGAAYHSKTDIDDMTGMGSFTMDPTGVYSRVPTVFNNVTYRATDFQWPETYAVGVAWNVNDKLMLAADIKRLMWGDSMKVFQFSNSVAGPTPFVQEWDDQTVYMIGGQYMVAPGVALRAGFNYAENPIPSRNINYLFPAITEKHYTLGLGWNIGGGHSVAASFMYAPKVEQTGNGTFNTGLSTSHSQTVWRLNYNYHF